MNTFPTTTTATEAAVAATLIAYQVLLHEERGDGIVIIFKCMAEDEEHAREQAVDAYPCCEIVYAHQANDTDQCFVIFSTSNDDAGYWSNEDGWTELAEATKFALTDMVNATLPVSANRDAKWVRLESSAMTAGNTAKVLFPPRDLQNIAFLHGSQPKLVAAFHGNRYTVACKLAVGNRVGQAAAEECFDITNNPGRIAERAKKFGNRRSVSVGDIVLIGGDAWLCQPFGWEKV